MLKIRDYSLSLRQDERVYPIITHVDMDITKGEIVGLIGESGCGKSMLWKSMLGLADPKRWSNSGNVIMNETDIDLRSAEMIANMRGKDVAVILQDPMNAFDQIFTIEQHFLETADAHGDHSRKHVTEKAVSLLKSLYIRDPEKVLRMYPFQCSGGMLQRIMIAIAMMMDTPFIIADEPTTAVDVTVQRQIITMLREINRSRKTAMLYISHDLRIIENLAHRVYVMYAGYTVESFPVEALKNGTVCHPYTQKLLMSRPSFTRELLPTMKGNPPSLEERGAGCPFAPRCDYVCKECRTFDMTEIRMNEQHTVRCVRAGGTL